MSTDVFSKTPDNVAIVIVGIMAVATIIGAAAYFWMKTKKEETIQK